MASATARVSAEALNAQARALFESSKAIFGYAVNGLRELKWEDLPPAVVKYIQDNPKTTALQLTCLLVTIMPGLVATPALVAFGFSSSGPVAGWLAATYQSIYGVGVTFSTLQSAAMGGWGVAVVNGAVQAGAIGVASMGELAKWMFKSSL